MNPLPDTMQHLTIIMAAVLDRNGTVEFGCDKHLQQPWWARWREPGAEMTLRRDSPVQVLESLARSLQGR